MLKNGSGNEVLMGRQKDERTQIQLDGRTDTQTQILKLGILLYPHCIA